MKLKFESGNLIIQRESGDGRVTKGGWGNHGWEAEHKLLYKVKQILNAAGFDLIKKRMSADGHLYGDEATPYLRARGKGHNHPHICIYDGYYAIRNSVDEYNEGREVIFKVGGDIWGKNQDWQGLLYILCKRGGIEV